MLLTPFASSSRGNLYQVDDGATRILLECGLTMNRIRKLLPHKLGDYRACLVTHEHKDHSRSVPELLRRGMDLYMTNGTAGALLDAPVPGLHIVTPGRQFVIGTLRIKPFATVHDCAEPCGFLIRSMQTDEVLAFATDTSVMRYRFPGMTEIALECNYSADLLAASQLPKAVRERAVHTHLSLESACCWLAAADLSKAQRIWLCHLSAAHGSAADFQRIVQQLTGVDTRVCDA